MYNAARIAYEPAAPNPDLVESHRMPQGHKQWDILTYERLADADALTEGVDVSAMQQLVAASLTVTPTEHGIFANISKRLRRRQGDTNVMSTTGMLLANSLRRLQDKDIITLYASFTKSTPGASLAIDVTHFRGAVAYLLTDNDTSYGPAPLPVHASLHIEQISDIIVDISDPGAVVSSRFGLSAELLQRWWRGSDRLYGVMVFHGGNIARDASGDSKGAIFAREALALVIAETPDAVEERDISLRATEVGITQEWSEAERADPHGVTVYSDSNATI